MAWQPTTDLDPLKPGERAFKDATTDPPRYAIVRLLEAPAPRGKEDQVYVLRPIVREVDADGKTVTENGRPVSPPQKTWTAYLARLDDPADFDDKVVQGCLERLDAHRTGLAVKGRYPSVEDVS